MNGAAVNFQLSRPRPDNRATRSDCCAAVKPFRIDGRGDCWKEELENTTKRQSQPQETSIIIHEAEENPRQGRGICGGDPLGPCYPPVAPCQFGPSPAGLVESQCSFPALGVAPRLVQQLDGKSFQFFFSTHPSARPSSGVTAWTLSPTNRRPVAIDHYLRSAFQLLPTRFRLLQSVAVDIPSLASQSRLAVLFPFIPSFLFAASPENPSTTLYRSSDLPYLEPRARLQNHQIPPWSKRTELHPPRSVDSQDTTPGCGPRSSRSSLTRSSLNS